MLSGNGLSIADNADLRLDSLTSALREKFIGLSDDSRKDGESQELSEMNDVLSALAQDVFPGCDLNDFEQIVGAFGVEEGRMELLSAIAQVTDRNTEMGEHIARVQKFLKALQKVATAHILETIDERHRSTNNEVSAFISGVIEEFEQRSFINLNYDNRLMWRLLGLCKSKGIELQDLATQAGNLKARGTFDLCLGLLDKKSKIEKKAIQYFSLVDSSEDDYAVRIKAIREAKTSLVHLHGSLGFFKTEDTDGVTHHIKVTVKDIRDNKLWERMRKRPNDFKLSPLVILSSQNLKRNLISQEPFKSAYLLFEHALADSDHWLIVGYSFRDEEVNKRFKQEILRRKSLSEQDDDSSKHMPTVLIVTYGDELEEEVVRCELGADVNDDLELLFERDGVGKTLKGDAWKSFVQSAG